MGKIDILVSGTSKAFSPEVPILESMPDFASQFDNNMYNLVPNGKCKFLVLFNHEKNSYSNFIRAGGDPKCTVLIRLEPNTVFPAQYEKRIANKYGLVISPGSKFSFEGDDSFIGWPYKYHPNPSKPRKDDDELSAVLNSNALENLFSPENWKQRSHKLVMIAGNKVSPISASNYGIRRRLAKTASASLLEVYGPLWNENLYFKGKHRVAVLVAAIKQGTLPNLLQIYGSLFTKYNTTRGLISNKHILLKDTKFNLVIENSNTTVTEKIFDAMINGCIPIYMGPDLKCFGIPSGITIESPKSISEIARVIENFSDEKIYSHLEAMKNFISGEHFKYNWHSEEVQKKISDLIKKHFESLS